MWLTLLVAIMRAVVLGAWLVLKPVLGWTLIVVGLIGMPMPIMNGLIFLVMGLALVGPRNKLIRWSRVRIKLLLYWWANLETPVVRPLGRLALRSAQQVSKQHRRLRWWWMDRQARRRAALEPAPRPQTTGD